VEERQRLAAARTGRKPWRKWGPYLSERQWGTVREDYSPGGDAWDHFTHDQARSRAYRWGEDGLAGISDDEQRLCFSLALWNGRDPILKERLFGLTNGEGNHGEDVKEYYFYLDSTPTHSYMKYLYKYPQAAFPYDDLVRTNRARTRDEPEYELLDTGVFDGDRYFDVFVELAKAGPEDLLLRLTVENRGPEEATLDLLPTLLFRNTWFLKSDAEVPVLAAAEGAPGTTVVTARHAELGELRFHCEGDVPLLFTDNASNNERLWGSPNDRPHVKDAFHRFLIHGETGAVNPARTGTKAAAHYRLRVPPGGSASVRLRLAATGAKPLAAPFADFDRVVAERRSEADEFYASITPPSLSADAALVMRQALAGMLWTKQYYLFDVDGWLEEHGAHPLLAGTNRGLRNRDWFHMVNGHVISMPDKWEYPWYAAWDLAFHAVALAMIDVDFAKGQLELMLQETYLHPSGQIPAYEWNFGDVNPPVHAWATWFVYASERDATGKGDLDFLKRSFHKLLLNFTWWVNRKDPSGQNVFEGGFLGLDNIGVFDRSAPLPTGGRLEQADGTAWMALFSQNMLEIALELAHHDQLYAEMAVKFVQHFLQTAAAMDRIGANDDEMWDEEDGFFYDLIRLPDGRAMRLKVRSMVGLLPLCATTVLPAGVLKGLPGLSKRVRDFVARHPELGRNISPPDAAGVGGSRMLSVLDERKLRRVLARMLDEREFLSPYGIRALSRCHLEHPFTFRHAENEYRVDYLPGESNTGMFGGNSNWRGPVWMPVNLLLVRALLQYYTFYGDALRVECPTGSGHEMTLFEVAQDLSRRLSAIFLRDPGGRRPVYGGSERFQADPHWRDLVLFYEYFHGDHGTGLGASHQTGWTGTVAKVLQLFGHLTAADLLAGGRKAIEFAPAGGGSEAS
jgi:hypothetical protein